jgi:phage N-6-adenine-methyltransferase
MIRTKEMIAAPVTENKDLWETPDHIFNPLDEHYKFSLDPCCLFETRKCKRFFTPKENGLMQSWAGHRVFVNPPYSRGNIDLWVEKCAKESVNSVIVALLPVSTSADWFQNYVLGNTIFWINKRVRFVGAPYAAPFSSMIVHFNGINKNLTWKQQG